MSRNDRRLGARKRARDAAQTRAALSSSSDPRLAVQSANRLFALGRPNETIDGLREAIRQAPDHFELRGALAYAFAATGQVSAAIDLYSELIAERGDHAGLHTNLAVLLAKAGRKSEATAMAGRAMELSPEHANTVFIYAELIERDDTEKAFRLYRKAARLFRKSIGPSPTITNADDLLKLADAELWTGELSAALSCYDRAISLRPDFVLAHVRRGLALAKLNRREQAIRSLRRAASLAPDSALVRRTIGDLLLETGNTEEAARYLKAAMKLNPNDKVGQYFLAAAGGADTPEAPPPVYIKQLFDSYAEKFDQHLVDVLKYRAPELICEAVLAACAASPKVIDLGCGTGLCGPLIKPPAKQLVGIDLSEKMLEKASERKIYDELICADLAAALERFENAFDVAISADVLVYIGALGPVFAACRRSLTADGILAFTVESHDGEGFLLDKTGRYCHAPSYVAQQAREHGFAVLKAQNIVPRYQAGKPVSGTLYVLQRKP